jgi:hypothetical protein
MPQARTPPNERLQLTANSALRLRFGRLLASTTGARATSVALLSAAERPFRWAAPGSLLQILPDASLLQTLLEVSVAFVGFSMLASVFRSGTGDELVRFASFRDVADVSLLAAL